MSMRDGSLTYGRRRGADSESDADADPDADADVDSDFDVDANIDADANELARRWAPCTGRTVVSDCPYSQWKYKLAWLND